MCGRSCPAQPRLLPTSSLWPSRKLVASEPVVNFLWSALHVMLLIVGGPVFWVLGLLTALLYSVIMFSLIWIANCYVFVHLGLFVMVFDSVRLLVELIGFCWTLVGLLVCHEPSFKWRGGAFLTFGIWKEFGCGPRDMRDMCECVEPMGVPCISCSLYKETKNQKLKTWARWFEEVMHMHEAIAL